MTSLIALYLMTNSACGFSPLLNHTYPDRHLPKEVAYKTVESLTCQFEFQSQSLCADFIWVKEPHGSDEGAMKIYFWKKNQPGVFTSVASLQVGVKLWMPDMGHGSQKVKVGPAQDTSGQVLAGVYDASEVMFVMGGDWEIQLQLKDSAGTVVEMQKIPYHAQ